MNIRVRIPTLTLGIAAVAIAIQFIPGAAQSLEFNRAAIGRGEWWRMFCGHLTHFDPNHLAWDVGVFFALGAVCEGQSRARFLYALGFASGAISAAIGWWQPHFEIYRGLSGLDCCLFGLFAGSLIRERHAAAKALGALAVTAACAKCALELTRGTTLFAAGTGYAPVPLAHLVGLAAGLAAAWTDHRLLAIFRRPAIC